MIFDHITLKILCEANTTLMVADIDECSPNPCLNGGKCIDGENGHTCNCDAGFSGPNCETSRYILCIVSVCMCVCVSVCVCERAILLLWR